MLHELVAKLVRPSPRMRRVVEQVVEQLLGSPLPADPEALRGRVRELLARASSSLTAESGGTEAADERQADGKIE